ncbi:MAG TPA: Asp-tRNA(Asn)/Glu-tRNA(Gln) amidotransferase subunit GatC [Candidatus Saccharibacteria bacterium]|nr:Asp-tRNA(Asn)/Glu-tRNA(Gln) amidotransferase subunit GatC [Candidatus Saccharibacteria bacterium]
MADLTRDDVLRLAALAKLDISDDEIEQYTKELSEILNYVEQLSAVDTEGLEPTSQVTGLTNIMRPDEEIDYGVSQELLLKNVPARKDNSIKVQRVL